MKFLIYRKMFLWKRKKSYIFQIQKVLQDKRFEKIQFDIEITL